MFMAVLMLDCIDNSACFLFIYLFYLKKCFFYFFLSSFTSQFRANILTLRIGRLLKCISLQVFSLSSVLQKTLFAL